jgi:hypothetical protein
MKRYRPASVSSNEGPHQRNLQREIAYRAARLMAEDGTLNTDAAKQKALRQMGITARGSLPDTSEIGAALRSYQALFQADSQPQECAFLRQTATDIMRRLDCFSPWLVGAVLIGLANRFSTIELEIVTDDAKRLEMFFLNEKISFKTHVERFHKTKRDDSTKEKVIFTFPFNGISIVINVYSHHSAQSAVHRQRRSKGGGAQIEEVERLLNF